MKYISIFLFYILCALNVSAQDRSADNMSIDAVFKACIAMRDAVSANDSAAIKQSAKDLKDAGTTSFSSLRCKDDSISSLNGHLVFDEAFADSIAEGKDVYDKTDDFTRTTAAHRGQTADGSILTKTCFVKAGKSTKYSFASKGH